MPRIIVSEPIVLAKFADFDMGEIPRKMQSFSEALYAPDYGSYLHFYENERSCKAYKGGFERYIDFIARFEGAVSQDWSVDLSAPIETQIEAIRRNEHSGRILEKFGIPHVPNLRFGDRRTYSRCFDGMPRGGTVIVGTHGTTKREDLKLVILAGVARAIRELHPKTLLFYGKVSLDLLDLCKQNGVNVVRYPSQCEIAHKRALEYRQLLL